MGNNASTKGLDDVTKRVESRTGKLQLSGRYHKLPKKIDDDYETLSKVLGSGYNGQVTMAKSKTTGDLFAVKAFKLNGVTKDKKEELESEAEIFLAMDHPHVARLADVYESEEYLTLIMECMGGGELFERVKDLKRFSEKNAADAVWQMLLSVNYIHTHGIVHRDLKLENFLYDAKGSNHLKLIDFGFSKIWDKNVHMELSCGTLAYVAPEVLEKAYTNKCDLWSLGVITFILLSGYMPFSGSEKHQVHCIQTGQYTAKPEVWKHVSAPGVDFVKKLLKVNAKERLSAEEALAHPWIAGRDQLCEDGGKVDQSVVDGLAQFAQASQFRRACMSMMAWSLTNEERAKVRDAFIELDSDRTGTIRIHELKKVLEEKFSYSDEKTQVIFEALDQNNNEEIHYTDFLAAMVSSRIQIHDDLVKAAFRRFDKDNSGHITVANLRDVLGDSFDAAEIDKMVNEADIAGDGQISYEEFIAYLRGGSADESHQQAAAKIIDAQILAGDGSKANLDVGGPAKLVKKTSAEDNSSKGPPAKASSEKSASASSCCVVS